MENSSNSHTLPPPVSQNLEPDQVNYKSSSSRKFLRGKFLKVSLLMLFFFIISFSGFVVAVAYDKISINNNSLQTKVSHLVQRLPLLPKTPKFLLEESILAHSRVTTQSFSMSLATRTNDTTLNQLGYGQLDFEISGDVDYQDVNNVKASINTRASVKSTPLSLDFEADIRKPDSMLYFKIDKIPSIINTYLPTETANKFTTLLGNWVSYDTAALDTEARRQLDQKAKENSSESIDKSLELYSDKRLLSLIKQSSDLLPDQTPVHKLSLILDADSLDYLYEKVISLSHDTSSSTLDLKQFEETKLSDYLKDFVVDIWVDKQKYFMRKAVATFTIKDDKYSASQALPAFSTTSSDYQISFASEFSNFGKQFTIEAPSSHITFDEFLNQAKSIFEIPNTRIPEPTLPIDNPPWI
jgi:hypothetical protein